MSEIETQFIEEEYNEETDSPPEDHICEDVYHLIEEENANG